jgi:hypothetical protein
MDEFALVKHNNSKVLRYGRDPPRPLCRRLAPACQTGRFVDIRRDALRLIFAERR